MYITGLGTAVPPQRYTQRECWEALLQSARFHELRPRSRAILKKVLNGSNGIATRHLALDNLGQAFELTPDVLQARFARNAPLLATQAAERALAESGNQRGRDRRPGHQHLHGLFVPRADELRERAVGLPGGRAVPRSRRPGLCGRFAEPLRERGAAGGRPLPAACCRSAWKCAAPRSISMMIRAC